MNETDKVAVCSRSFSRHPVLRAELLSKYRHVTFNDEGLKLNGDSLVSYLEGHDKAITALETIDQTVLSRLPGLKVIGKYGVGVDMIDMKAMADHNVRLGWTGGVNKRSVSELVLAFAIALLRHGPAAHREVLGGTWRQHMGRHLSGRCVGIIGCGHIGKDLVKMLKPFECKVLAHDIRSYSDFYQEHNVEATDLDDLLVRSDIVTLHVPLDDSTANMLDREKLSLLKADAILINAARGGLLDESHLKHMLQTDKLAAAALDVFSVEPPEDTELLELPNFLVSPHIGGSSEEAILAMGRSAIAGLDENSIPGDDFGV